MSDYNDENLETVDTHPDGGKEFDYTPLDPAPVKQHTKHSSELTFEQRAVFHGVVGIIGIAYGIAGIFGFKITDENYLAAITRVIAFGLFCSTALISIEYLMSTSKNNDPKK